MKILALFLIISLVSIIFLLLLNLYKININENYMRINDLLIPPNISCKKELNINSGYSNDEEWDSHMRYLREEEKRHLQQQRKIH